MFREALVYVTAGVVLAVVLAAGRWSVGRAPNAWRWLAARPWEIVQRRRRAAAERSFANAVEEARLAGEAVVTDVRGRNPARVRLEGACPGEQLWFTEFPAYRQAMESRAVSPLSTFWGRSVPSVGHRQPCGRC